MILFANINMIGCNDLLFYIISKNTVTITNVDVLFGNINVETYFDYFAYQSANKICMYI